MSESDAIWRADGHLTAEAAVAAGDGQVADAAVAAHVQGCDPCLRAVGRAARRSLQVDELLRLASRVDPQPRAHAPSRRRTLAAAAILIGAFAAGRLSALGSDSGPLPTAGTYQSTARLQLDRDLTVLAAGAAVAPIGDLRLQLDGAQPPRGRGGCPARGRLQ